MFKLFKKLKRLKHYSEGLYLLKSGIEVRLRQVEWFLNCDDLEADRRIKCETIKTFCEQILRDIEAVQNEKLHF